ncbi:MAG: NUDIX domain-containing protein [Clostridia bacterium]|nr:NUDIX domain-containing protein [Clostridia bacterium]
MENWEILTADGRPSGRSIIRGKDILRQGEYHLVVHIWITDGYGNYLIQRRSLNKKLMPGEWAAIGGSAVMYEKSKTAAQRELFEEMGIKAHPDRLQFVKRMTRKSSIIDIYALKTRVRASSLKLQKDEVSEAKWVTRRRLEQMVTNGEFHNYGNEYFKIVYQLAADLHD